MLDCVKYLTLRYALEDLGMVLLGVSTLNLCDRCPLVCRIVLWPCLKWLLNKRIGTSTIKQLMDMLAFLPQIVQHSPRVLLHSLWVLINHLLILLIAMLYGLHEALIYTWLGSQVSLHDLELRFLYGAILLQVRGSLEFLNFHRMHIGGLLFWRDLPIIIGVQVDILRCKWYA